MTDQNKKNTRIKTYVRRGRMTKSQLTACHQMKSSLQSTADNQLLDFNASFKRVAPCALEIGFGSGQSLLAAAQLKPEWDFIGIETHRPGIGALMLGMSKNNISNIFIYEADAIDVLQKNIPDNSLDIVQLFFPDPWQKRRHYARRIIQPDFVALVSKKLKKDGELHVATDWEDYAHHMMTVLSDSPHFKNKAGLHTFSDRSPMRPIETKFEKRAIREGRKIYDLLFVKVAI